MTPCRLNDYVSGLRADSAWADRQNAWYANLDKALAQGEALYEKSSEVQHQHMAQTFSNWVKTEELKAWYGAPEGDSLFQGTSVSSLTIPCKLDAPIELSGIEDLEGAIASHYIRLHDAHAQTVCNTSLESVEGWLKEGLYFGVVIGAKMISQAFHLSVPQRDVVFSVQGKQIDPHQILRHSKEIRSEYFAKAQERVECLADLCLTQTEFEQSLVLADISKPKINALKDRLILGPVRCNEIAAMLSRRVVARIREQTNGRIAPRSLMVTIYDTDSPYTYHEVSGYAGHPLAPILPGLVVLGSSGSMDAFRWLYAYRCSLIAQKIMKSSLWSQVEGCFIPFVFFGVLVQRDAEILLDLDNLGVLRYPGMISPMLEYTYLLSKLQHSTNAPTSIPSPLAEWRTRQGS